MTNEEYRASPGINWTNLKLVGTGDLDRDPGGTSPLHALDALYNPRPASAAMDMGTAVHCAVLEPRAFPLRYVVVSDEWLKAPRLNRATSEGKAFRDSLPDAIASVKDADTYKAAVFRMEHPGQEVLSGDDYDTCLAIGDAVRSHPIAGPLVEGAGWNEHPIFWIDPVTGLLCKAKIDRLAQFPPTMPDLKTSRDIGRRRFSYQASDLGYAGQVAYYKDGVREAMEIDASPCIIAVENHRPFDVAVLDVEEEELSIGRARYRACLDRLARCRDSGEWPGQYPTRSRLVLPRNAYPDENDIDDLMFNEGGE